MCLEVRQKLYRSIKLLWNAKRSVSVVKRLKGSVLFEAQVLGLIVAHLGQRGAQYGQMEAGNVLVDLSREEIDL
jgi:hypothetical protein